MNQQERDELRAKHRLVDYRHGADYPKCGYCNLGEWPCDTIRVLDWAERELRKQILLQEQAMP